MRKNFDEIFSTIEIDTVTGRYYTTIPEEIINELLYTASLTNDLKYCIGFTFTVSRNRRSIERITNIGVKYINHIGGCSLLNGSRNLIESPQKL